VTSFLKPVLIVCFAANLVACAFVPKVDHKQKYARNCEMYTKELTLDAVSLGGLDCGGNSSCVVVASLVPVTTFLVSGSIVLVGNTVHWLEYQGSCDESLLHSSINKLIPEKEAPLDSEGDGELLGNGTQEPSSIILTLEAKDTLLEESNLLVMPENIEKNEVLTENQ